MDKRLCPTCGYLLDAVTGATASRPPKAGDVGVCISCGSVLVLDGSGLPVRLAEPDDVQLRPEAQRVLDAAVATIQRRGPLPPRGARA